MKVVTTDEIVFSFEGPNLCILGSPLEFESLSKAVADLTNPGNYTKLRINELSDMEFTDLRCDLIFESKHNAKNLGLIHENSYLVQLAPRAWERLFKYFVLMSWQPSTYYLNNYEDCLIDLDLEQEFNFICSSEF